MPEMRNASWRGIFRHLSSNNMAAISLDAMAS